MHNQFASLVGTIFCFIISISWCFANESQQKMELVDDQVLGILFRPASVFYQGVTAKERHLIEQFAEEHQLLPKWVAIEETWQLISALISGQGDVIVGHGLSLTYGSVDQVRFAYAWGEERQQLVARLNTTRISGIEDFSMRQIALKKSSLFWSVFQQYMQQHAAMDLVVIPELSTEDAILQRVSSGLYDVTVFGSDYLNANLAQYPDLEVVFNFSDTKLRAWAVRADAPVLQSHLNKFLERKHLSVIAESNYVEDMPKIRARKLLRVITYPSMENYFFKQGRMYGFEYAFIRQFAASEGLSMSIVLANSHDKMRDILLNGGGDLIAAALPSNSFDDADISMTVAYDYTMPIIVGRDSERGMIDATDLQGRKVMLSANNPYLVMLESLQYKGIDFEINVADIEISTQTILQRVSDALYDLTILSGQQIKTELRQQDSLKPLFSLSQPIGKSWAVKSSAYKLLASLNAYIEKEYRGNLYNTLYNRYFVAPSWRNFINSPMNFSRLSPYDELIKKQSSKHHFDWRLITAQMYQESQFDPEAVSDAGALGLMQIMPRTADELGITDLSNPVSNIIAGIEYMEMLRTQFEQGLLLAEKTWFTLAAYNAGFGRIKDARALAVEMGLDGDRWFDNVERAMLVLAMPNPEHGSAEPVCNCNETVGYVADIRFLYRNYVRMTDNKDLLNISEFGYLNY